MRTRKTKPPAFRYSPLVAALAMVLSPHAGASPPIEVTNTDPSGPGSLRQAVLDANLGCFGNSAPVIAFNIPGTGPFTIAQSPGFPTFQCSNATGYTPTIEATSLQTGASPNTLANGFDASTPIILDGLAYGGCGLNWADPFSYGGYLAVKGPAGRPFHYTRNRAI